MNSILFLITLLTIAATLVNPYGFDVAKFVYKTLSDQSIQKFIYEWQSPTPEGIANISFFTSILVIIATVPFSRYKPTLTELLLILGFTWLAWSSQRSIIWYSMVTIPILVQILASLPNNKFQFVTQTNWLNTLLMIVFIVPAVSVQPWFVEKVPLSEKFWMKVYRNNPEGPLVAIETPIRAAEYLKQHPGGDIFNEMGYGSYLIWAVPEQKVFIDPRIELYPLDQWDDYLDITNCYRYNERLAKYEVDRILLDKIIQPELATCLASDISWKLEFQDERSQIWKKE